MRKRLPLLLLLLFCLSGCRAPAPETGHSQNPPASVIAMSSPELLTPEPAPSTEPKASTESAPPEPTPSTEPRASTEPMPTEPDSSTEPRISTEPAPSMEPEASAEPAPPEPEGMYLLVNGTRIAPGMPYAEVREGIGGEIAPQQELRSCDGSFFGTVHYYPGLTVTENEAGVIRGIEINSMFEGEGDAALLGRVGLGAGMDEAVAALGQPENAASAKEDCLLIYRQDGQEIYVYFLDADSPEAVSGLSMTLP